VTFGPTDRRSQAPRRAADPEGRETLAQVALELDIQLSVVRQWKRQIEAGKSAGIPSAGFGFD